MSWFSGLTKFKHQAKYRSYKYTVQFNDFRQRMDCDNKKKDPHGIFHCSEINACIDSMKNAIQGIDLFVQ